MLLFYQDELHFYIIQKEYKLLSFWVSKINSLCTLQGELNVLSFECVNCSIISERVRLTIIPHLLPNQFKIECDYLNFYTSYT